MRVWEAPPQGELTQEAQQALGSLQSWPLLRLPHAQLVLLRCLGAFFFCASAAPSSSAAAASRSSSLSGLAADRLMASRGSKRGAAACGRAGRAWSYRTKMAAAALRSAGPQRAAFQVCGHAQDGSSSLGRATLSCGGRVGNLLGRALETDAGCPDCLVGCLMNGGSGVEAPKAACADLPPV